MGMLKILSFGLMGAMALYLSIASVSSDPDSFYSSPAMTAGWGILSVSAFAYIIRRKVWRRPATFAIHAAFALILCGGLVTRLGSESGTVHLRHDAPAESTVSLPFEVGLDSFEVVTYPGTSTPMDFVTAINIDGVGQDRISMNNVLAYRGYRFFQSTYDDDGLGTTLLVSHDPWGTGLTYAGYALLLLSFLAYPFERRWLKPAVFVILGCVSLSASAVEKPRYLPRRVASSFDGLCIMHNGRIAPFASFSRDLTIKLYGNDSYNGLDAEQVVTGFLFYFDSWKSQPVIKVKNRQVREALGLDGRYASYQDFIDPSNQSRLTMVIDSLKGVSPAQLRPFLEAAGKIELINMLRSGKSLKIFPVKNGSKVDWYSPADRLPFEIDDDTWLFVRKALGYVNENVLAHKYDEVTSVIEKIILYQMNVCGDVLPSASEMSMEAFYHAILPPQAGVGVFLVAAIVLFLLAGMGRKVSVVAVVLSVLAWIYITSLIVIRWILSGHVPLSNGFETMQFLAWCALGIPFLVAKRFAPAASLGLVVAGLAMMVATFSISDPAITMLMPVLASPLLSIHVMVIMLSYTLLAFMMLLGIAALIWHFRGNDREVGRLALISRKMLYPAVFLLASGIFIGAVWANNAWGRYWGWDPKEVWALITLLVYSFALHKGSMHVFGRPLFFHVYMIAAFLCVMITYFGVNFFLGGMHSYA